MTKPKKSKGWPTGGGGAGAGYALPTTVGIVNHDPTRQRAPGYSFGTRLYEKNRAAAPGPHYNVDTGLTPRGTGHSPSYSITGRPRRTVWDSMMAKGPSPNTYTVPNTHIPWEKNAPMYSFGFPYRSKKRDHIPAPNTYNIPGTLGSQAPDLKTVGPASTMHGKASGAKGFSYDFAKTPGPAKYDPVDLTHTSKRAPATTMKSRTKLPPLSTATPGPAAYDPGNLEKVSKNSPRMRLKVRYNDNMRPPLFTLTDVRH